MLPSGSQTGICSFIVIAEFQFFSLEEFFIKENSTQKYIYI